MMLTFLVMDVGKVVSGLSNFGLFETIYTVKAQDLNEALGKLWAHLVCLDPEIDCCIQDGEVLVVNCGCGQGEYTLSEVSTIE